MQMPTICAVEVALEHLNQRGGSRQSISHDLERHLHAERFGHRVNVLDATDGGVAVIVVGAGLLRLRQPEVNHETLERDRPAQSATQRRFR